MKRSGIRCICGASLIGLLLLTAVHVPNAEAQESDSVTSLQTLEVDGMRPIGLSPDGNLFAASDFGRRALCVYTVEPFAEQVCTDLTPLEAGLRLSDVSWSPDSTRLVMAENAFMLLRDGDIWVMDVSTGGLINVTDDGYNGNFPLGDDAANDEAALSFDVSPTWSPDGQSITYSRSSYASGDWTGNDIVTTPADGGDPDVLVNVSPVAPGVAYLPMRWSPDGQTLYYTVSSLDQDDPRNGIYRYDAATGSSEMIVKNSAERGVPALVEVSPAGDRLLIWYPMITGQYGSSEPIYWIVDVGSGETNLVTLPPVAGEDGYVGATTFSPDGSSLLVGTRYTTPDFQLWEVDLESGDSTRLVESLPGVMVMDYSLPPSWTASGRIFVASNIGSGTLLTVPSRQAPMSPTVRIPAVDATPEATGFETGDRVFVSSPGVPLYAAPTSSSPAVLLLAEGAELTVLGPAEEGDGTLWIPVQEHETRTIGFVRVDFLVTDDLTSGDNFQQTIPTAVPGQAQLNTVHDALEGQGLSVEYGQGGSARIADVTPPGQLLIVDGQSAYVFIFFDPDQRELEMQGLEPNDLVLTDAFGDPITLQPLAVATDSNVAVVTISGDEDLIRTIANAVATIP